jgi:cytochrome oxidase Cu insertion factor (SCO1/SenC/PrrC family)
MRAFEHRRECLWLTLLILVVAVSPISTGADELEDFLLDMAIVPLDGKLPVAFTLERLDGKRTSLKDLSGQVVLLYFWKTT